MLSDLRHAMLQAAALTRRQDLKAATKAIQDALSGRGPSGEDGNREVERGPHIAGLVSNVTKLAARPLGLPSAKRSLGEVLKTLRGRPMTHPPYVTRRSPSLPTGARFLTRTFECAAGNRSYRLYIPSRSLAEPRALVVMLHGCQQDGDDFAAGTRMNHLAEEFGFLVAYPNQSKAMNPSGCWNWFRPGDQRRGEGEPLIIAGIANSIVAQYQIDRARVFVAGLSAGGAMAAIMGATYPDIFSAIGVHSGLAPGSAHDVMSAFAAMRGDVFWGDDKGAVRGTDAIPIRTIVFHGDCDPTVHPSNAARIFELAGTDGDGRSTETGTCGGRSFTRTIVQEKDSTALERWMIHGAGHAWSGGSSAGSFSDPEGPDASREIVRFFLRE